MSRAESHRKEKALPVGWNLSRKGATEEKAEGQTERRRETEAGNLVRQAITFLKNTTGNN